AHPDAMFGAAVARECCLERRELGPEDPLSGCHHALESARHVRLHTGGDRPQLEKRHLHQFVHLLLRDSRNIGKQGRSLEPYCAPASCATGMRAKWARPGVTILAPSIITVSNDPAEDFAGASNLHGPASPSTARPATKASISALRSLSFDGRSSQ